MKLPDQVSHVVYHILISCYHLNQTQKEYYQANNILNFLKEMKLNIKLKKIIQQNSIKALIYFEN